MSPHAPNEHKFQWETPKSSVEPVFEMTEGQKGSQVPVQITGTGTSPPAAKSAMRELRIGVCEMSSSGLLTGEDELDIETSVLQGRAAAMRTVLRMIAGKSMDDVGGRRREH